LKKQEKNVKKAALVMTVGIVYLCSGLGSGSGGVRLAPLDRGDRCGHFDTGLSAAVAVLAEIWEIGKKM
jgi:hypothetical protein